MTRVSSNIMSKPESTTVAKESESLEARLDNIIIDVTSESAQQVAKAAIEKVQTTIQDKVNMELEKRNIQISKETIVTILLVIMEIAETDLTKYDNRKDIVLSVLKKLIELSSLDEETKSLIMIYIKSDFLTNTIDTICDVAKGKVKINKKTFLSCLALCSSL